MQIEMTLGLIYDFTDEEEIAILFEQYDAEYSYYVGIMQSILQ